MKSLNIAAICLILLSGMVKDAQGQTKNASTTQNTSASSVKINGLRIDNIGISDHIFRQTDNGDLFLDQAGMHLEVTMNVTAKGVAGERLICCLEPLSPDGNTFHDNQGDLISMRGFTPTSGSTTTAIKIPIPYNWVIREDEKIQTISFLASVLIPMRGENGIMAEQTINVDPTQVNVDKDQLPGHLIGQLFGGSSSKNSQSGIGSLIGSLFGGPTATSTRDCSACDGMGICPHCDGDGFFAPDICRKCAKNPGVCRRCGGSGTEEIEMELHESIF